MIMNHDRLHCLIIGDQSRLWFSNPWGYSIEKFKSLDVATFWCCRTTQMSYKTKVKTDYRSESCGENTDYLRQQKPLRRAWFLMDGYYAVCQCHDDNWIHPSWVSLTMSNESIWIDFLLSGDSSIESAVDYLRHNRGSENVNHFTAFVVGI